jgi:hypothetical protein
MFNTRKTHSSKLFKYSALERDPEFSQHRLSRWHAWTHDKLKDPIFEGD